MTENTFDSSDGLRKQQQAQSLAKVDNMHKEKN